MLSDRGLADAQLACNEEATNSVFNQISVALWREVLFRIPQPLKNLQPSIISERLDSLR